jgi:hypothetical protein
LNEDVFKRRLKLIKMLALENKLPYVVDVLSKEYGCSKRMIYKDSETMVKWARSIEQNEQAATIIRGQLDLLNREALDLMLSWPDKDKLSIKEKFVKIGAINCSLKIVDRKIKLHQDLGHIKQAPITVQNLAITTPFEADPVLRQAILASMEKQKAERDAAKPANADGH